MKHLKIALIALSLTTLSGCQSYQDYVQRIHNNQTTGELKATSNGPAYFRTSGARNERKLTKSEQAYIDQINGQRNAFYEAESEKWREQEKREAEMKQASLTCNQKAQITYRIWMEEAYITGDYSKVHDWDVNKLTKYCQKGKK